MFKYALSLILRRKLRTMLTSLGIMIAVMLMTFILFGMTDLQRAVLTQFSSVFKPTDLYVSSQDLMFGGMLSAPTKQKEEKKEPVIVNETVKRKIETLDGVESVDSMFLLNGLEIYLEGDSIPYPTQIVQAMSIPGDDPTFISFDGENPILEENGIFVSDFVVSFFETTNDEIVGKKLIAKSVSSSFMSAANKNMIDKEYEFFVQGVVETANKPFWISTDKALNILVDMGGFESNEEYIEKIGYSQLLVHTKDGKTTEVESIMTEDMGLSVMSTKTVVDFISTLTAGLTISLVVFGAISALVASIGIINTMIMSIYEQTREIGIIKAIGASNTQVLVIFLIQSGLIGLIGGVLGLSITFALMQIADPFIVEVLKEQGFGAIDKFFYFQLGNALIITFSSILVGVIAGIYPAMKAARLDPVKALRYE